MRFMLMMHAPYGTGDYEIFHWSPEDLQAHMAFLNSLNKELKEAGEWVEVQGLTPPGQATLVRAGSNGAPVTDGPFPESKEFLAGFWIVEVDSLERAIQIAAKASAAPGPGGVTLNTPIEVREVMSAPPSPDA